MHATVEPPLRASELLDQWMAALLCSDVGCNSSEELCRAQLGPVTRWRCLAEAVASSSVAV